MTIVYPDLAASMAMGAERVESEPVRDFLTWQQHRLPGAHIGFPSLARLDSHFLPSNLLKRRDAAFRLAPCR
jgi:hypothetical protein